MRSSAGSSLSLSAVKPIDPLSPPIPAAIRRSSQSRSCSSSRAPEAPFDFAQPILLTLSGDNPNGADVRFLVDGAVMPADAGRYRRIVLLFDGEDAETLAAARERWTAAKAEGFDVTYWQMDEAGRWQRQAGS